MNEVIVFHKIFNKIYFSFPSVRRGIQSEMEKYINLLIKHKGEKNSVLKNKLFLFFLNITLIYIVKYLDRANFEVSPGFF